MPVTRSQKGSTVDMSERRANIANQEQGTARGATTSRNTELLARSASNLARIAAGATGKDDASTSAGTMTGSGTTVTTTEYTTSTENTASTETDVTTATTQQTENPNETVKPAKRTKSQRSDANKKKLAELEAQEKLAELKLEEIRAAVALAQARLERQRAAADDDEAPSLSEGEEEQSSRVQEWLEGQTKDPSTEKVKVPEDREMEGRGQGAHKQEDCEHRGGHEGTRPARHPQSVDIPSLAAAFSQAVRMSRDAPKYLQELPVFNGHCDSWLAFRAAYYETEALFSKSENVSRLRKSIRGAALEATSDLFISQTDPAAVVQTLESKRARWLTL